MRFAGLFVLTLFLLTFRLSLLSQVPAVRDISMPKPAETLPLWPEGVPEPPHVQGPEFDPSKPTDANVGGIRSVRVTNVTNPTLLWYPATGRGSMAPNGAAVVVFPGGGYVRLAINEEGTEVCTWLNSLGVGCALVKYRVPEVGRYPENTEDLEDAQRAVRIVRGHAAQWGLDPQRIGVFGGSAGAHLAIVLSTHPNFRKDALGPVSVPAAQPPISARPDFQILLYPAYVDGPDGKLLASVRPTRDVPPTFLVMAEDDRAAHVESALTYYQGLKDAGVPAEMHLYARGGHGFGLRPTGLPEAGWPALAASWMRDLGIVPQTPVR